MSANCCVVLTYLIRIMGSTWMRSKNQSRSTRGVRGTWRLAGLLPLFMCFLTASLSSKMFNEGRILNNRAFRETQSMSPNGSWCFKILGLMNMLGVASSLELQEIYDLCPTNSLLECPLCVTWSKAVSKRNDCAKVAWLKAVHTRRLPPKRSPHVNTCSVASVSQCCFGIQLSVSFKLMKLAQSCVIQTYTECHLMLVLSLLDFMQNQRLGIIPICSLVLDFQRGKYCL